VLLCKNILKLNKQANYESDRSLRSKIYGERNTSNENRNEKTMIQKKTVSRKNPLTVQRCKVPKVIYKTSEM